MATNSQSSHTTTLISKLQTTASNSQNIEHDEATRATLLQLSRELTASLQAPDEVCSLLAFSVRTHHPTNPTNPPNPTKPLH